jgi:hypothetical protein
MLLNGGGPQRRRVSACRYALLVQLLDVPYDPMVADADKIEALRPARRVLPPPSSVGDGEGPGRVASSKPIHLIGMNGEPTAQGVIEIVRLARAEQKIISRLSVQAPVAGMPVRLQHAQRVIQLPVDSYRGDYPLCTPANTRLMLQAPDREFVINVFNAVVEESQLSHRLRATV